MTEHIRIARVVLVCLTPAIMGCGLFRSPQALACAVRCAAEEIGRQVEAGDSARAQLNVLLQLAAATTDDADVIVSLLSLGADVNSSDSRGYTPLHLAMENGRFGLVTTLLDGGADNALRTNEGKLAIELADLTVIPAAIQSRLIGGRSP